jgi:putative acetyltransferase
MASFLRDEPLDSPVAQQLIAELNAELSRDYKPEERFHSLAAEEVAEGAGAFVVAWLDGEPAGCGAVRMLSDAGAEGGAVAELKRMYVRPFLRGRGLSRRILSELEARAATLGATRVVLETGIYQPAAIALYESSSYAKIPPFGPYVASPTSVCYEKGLMTYPRIAWLTHHALTGGGPGGSMMSRPVGLSSESSSSCQ